MQRALAAMTTGERAQASGKICARVLALSQWQAAKRVMLFAPLRTEPDLRGLRDDPGFVSKVVTVLPATANFIWLENLGTEMAEIILVPGLAFTSEGLRLGRGGGYFDRLLEGALRGAYKVGVCFASQMIAALPTETHDVRMDRVITEG